MPPSPALKRNTQIVSPDTTGNGHGRLGTRPGRLLALTLLAAYKSFISPLFTGCCRFEPSCSDYAAQAISTHGVLRGLWLGVKRVARCHPFGGAGLDPCPTPTERRMHQGS